LVNVELALLDEVVIANHGAYEMESGMSVNRSCNIEKSIHSPARGPIRQEYPERKANKPLAFLMMFHGVDTIQKSDMKMVALKMLIYLGAIPVMS
tara:strand:+ start:4968 stop:5252 length:285 start_codon:yes stop_codon:yes gene_type:complete